MLGEVIGEGQGKRTGRRVLASGSDIAVEVSFEDHLKLLGHEGLNIGTYVSHTRADGTMEGQGQGAFATMEGDFLSWKGVGTGKFLPNGSVSYRGGLSYFSNSPKLARLNSVAGVFEFEVDMAGNTKTKMWEWK